MASVKKTGGKTTGKTARSRSCPMCGKAAATTHLPFCSSRCADLDLGFWLTGAYRIPAVEPPDSLTEDTPDAPPPPARPGFGNDRDGD